MLQQPRIRVGDTLEVAIWLDGRETPQQVERFKAEVVGKVAEENERSGAVTGPWRWVEKLPGEERVPPVPDHIQGLCVRLLVGECDVLNVRPSESRFLAELEPSDLRRLRRHTRKAHERWFKSAYPLAKYRPITDRQCDTLINDLGPEAAVDALVRGFARLNPNPETAH